MGPKKLIFIRSLVGWWTGTGWSRTIGTAQKQLTMFEARCKTGRMKEDGERVRIYELPRREVPLNDKQVLLGDDAVQVRKAD